ncbi:MAG: hypothetical protein U0Q55_08675 [Vicinamibacterales bacterium]
MRLENERGGALANPAAASGEQPPSGRGADPDAGGFSLVELAVALAVSTLVTTAVFAMLDPANGAFRTQPEAVDVAQRGRAAVDALVRDLAGAGGVPFAASTPARSAAAVVPYRIGRRSADPPGSFDPSRIAVWQVAPEAPYAPLASALASAAGTATIAPGPGCQARPSCGFVPGMAVAAFSHSGIVDLFSIVAVNGAALVLQHNQADSARVYPPGETVLAEVRVGTYFFRRDPVSGAGQLRRYNGDTGADVPVVDHVESLAFELWGEADGPRVVAVAGTEKASYGPAPPPVSVQPTAYPPGENCAFARGPMGEAVPRLQGLGGASALVPLPASLLTDGPWCPDALSPIRYDADLLRVRQVVVSLRTEAATDALRGPAGWLFARAGTARSTRVVPDRRIRLAVALPGTGGGL